MACRGVTSHARITTSHARMHLSFGAINTCVASKRRVPKSQRHHSHAHSQGGWITAAEHHHAHPMPPAAALQSSKLARGKQIEIGQQAADYHHHHQQKHPKAMGSEGADPPEPQQKAIILEAEYLYVGMEHLYRGVGCPKAQHKATSSRACMHACTCAHAQHTMGVGRPEPQQGS
eukprot:scaffold22686_cov21-Tisochrysis_lutea.AAC.1